MYGATIGKLGTLEQPAATNQACAALLSEGLTEKLIPFAFYYLLSSREDLQKIGQGGAQPNISQTILKEYACPLPPANEQRRIVEKIEALTARSRKARAALNEIPALLDQFRQSVLAAAFRGDLTADWRAQNPNVEPAEALLEKLTHNFEQGKSTGRAATVNIIAGRSALSVGDPKTPVPSGWIRLPLLKVARLESGHTPSRNHPEYWGGSIPWIGIADARDNHGCRIFSTKQYTNELGLENSAARLLPKETVCLSRTASVGYALIMGESMATSQDFVNWICSPALLPDFLLYALLAEGDHLLKFGKGTTHTTIYFPEVKSFYVTLPPIREQYQIVKVVQERLAMIDSLKQHVDSLLDESADIDQSILAKAFCGELVPQDPNDEPAAVLLDRIRAERERLGSGKKRGKAKG